ncbi:MAG: SH3 domain-containing protein [Candidatus Omnitrophota bacterium]
MNKDNINIRVDATVASPSLGYLAKGEIVSILEDKFDWAKIILPKRFSAYAASQFLKKLGDNKVEVLVSDLNLRNQPTLSSYTIGRADRGSVFFYRSQENGWFELRCYPYTYGWVNKNFLTKLQKPISVEGEILFLRNYTCEANCVLKTNTTEYLLSLLYKGKAKFLNKKVKIQGVQIKGSGCTYIYVYKLVFLK